MKPVLCFLFLTTAAWAGEAQDLLSKALIRSEAITSGRLAYHMEGPPALAPPKRSVFISWSGESWAEGGCAEGFVDDYGDPRRVFHNGRFVGASAIYNKDGSVLQRRVSMGEGGSLPDDY